METLLTKFLSNRWINNKDKVLVVCGSSHDDQILKRLGFKNRLITSAYKALPDIKYYKQSDAQDLPFKDESFDLVLVNLGLHHCASPHQALCEMYRVAKKTVIVHEAQDSLAIRLMTKLGIVLDYEIAKGEDEHEGIKNTSIVNYVYRWTKREIQKTINSYDPAKVHHIHYFSKFLFHSNFLGPGGFWEKKLLVRLLGKNAVNWIITRITSVINLILADQGNDFSFVIRKNISQPQPWVKNKTYFKNIFKQVIIRA